MLLQCFTVAPCALDFIGLELILTIRCSSQSYYEYTNREDVILRFRQLYNRIYHMRWCTNIIEMMRIYDKKYPTQRTILHRTPHWCAMKAAKYGNSELLGFALLSGANNREYYIYRAAKYGHTDCILMICLVTLEKNRDKLYRSAFLGYMRSQIRASLKGFNDDTKNNDAHHYIETNDIKDDNNTNGDIAMHSSNVESDNMILDDNSIDDDSVDDSEYPGENCIWEGSSTTILKKMKQRGIKLHNTILKYKNPNYELKLYYGFDRTIIAATCNIDIIRDYVKYSEEYNIDSHTSDVNVNEEREYHKEEFRIDIVVRGLMYNQMDMLKLDFINVSDMENMLYYAGDDNDNIISKYTTVECLKYVLESVSYDEFRSNLHNFLWMAVDVDNLELVKYLIRMCQENNLDIYFNLPRAHSMAVYQTFFSHHDFYKFHYRLRDPELLQYAITSDQLEEVLKGHNKDFDGYKNGYKISHSAYYAILFYLMNRSAIEPYIDLLVTWAFYLDVDCIATLEKIIGHQIRITNDNCLKRIQHIDEIPYRATAQYFKHRILGGYVM